MKDKNVYKVSCEFYIKATSEDDAVDRIINNQDGLCSFLDTHVSITEIPTSMAYSVEIEDQYDDFDEDENNEDQAEE